MMMYAERHRPPMGSRRFDPSWCPMYGKDSEIALSQTSFSASCARACTDDDGIFEHHTQRTAFTPIVASIVAIPIGLRSTGVVSPCSARCKRCKDSINTWTNEMIMTTEKMSWGERRRVA
jgi:hypothetical protein